MNTPTCQEQDPRCPICGDASGSCDCYEVIFDDDGEDDMMVYVNPDEGDK